MGGRAPGEALSRAQEGFLGGSRQSLRGGIELVQKLMCGNHPGPRRTVTRPGWGASGSTEGLTSSRRGALPAGTRAEQETRLSQSQEASSWLPCPCLGWGSHDLGSASRMKLSDRF